MICAATSGATILPPFPRAAPTFVGRQRELQRVLDLLDSDVLFLVYGVGGIGKSEFVYRVCAFLPLIGLLTVFLPNIEKLRRAAAG